MGHPGDKLYHQRSSAVVYPIAMAHANGHANPEAMVSIMAGLLLAFSVGASISPFFAARDEMGGTIELYCSVIYASLAGFTSIGGCAASNARDYRLRGTAADLAVERCRCRPSPRATISNSARRVYSLNEGSRRSARRRQASQSFPPLRKSPASMNWEWAYSQASFAGTR